MIGSQALIGFKNSDGLMTVNTYNISSYAALVESKVAFEVSKMNMEYPGGLMKIFATVVLPEKGNSTTVNQVWQVGASMTSGVPDKHAFQPTNLNSKGTLDLLNGQGSGATGGDSRLTKENGLIMKIKAVLLQIFKLLLRKDFTCSLSSSCILPLVVLANLT